jgi:glycine/D-amino acid oxidase-like deaminating enzyme
VTATADVIIIGGGIVGVSIASCLGLKKPRRARMVLLEKRALCSEPTSKSVGVIYLQHSTNNSQLVRGWVGLRTVTPDCLPILGETGVKGFLCAVGFSGTGTQLGLATAQIISELILAKLPLPIWKSFPSGDFLEIKLGITPSLSRR